MNELLTKEQQFNEIPLPQDSTYCISLMGMAVQLGLIAEEHSTKIIERLTRFFEGIAQNTSENRQISVSSKIIVKNYFLVLTFYLSHRPNFDAFELMQNLNTSELVEKAENALNDKLKIKMAQVADHKIPNGMFTGVEGIQKAYRNILRQYRIYDLNDVYMFTEKYSLAILENIMYKNPIIDFFNYIDNFLLECTILNKKFDSTIIDKVYEDLQDATSSMKKQKLKEIDDKIEKLMNAKKAKLDKINKKLAYYREKQEEVDNLLNGLTEEELDSGKYDDEIAKYDFDIDVIETKARYAKLEIEAKSDEILQKLENKKEKIETCFKTEQEISKNVLVEVIKEWIVYNWFLENKLNYKKLTNVQKEEFIGKLEKKWLLEKIHQLNLEEKHRKYVENVLV